MLARGECRRECDRAPIIILLRSSPCVLFRQRKSTVVCAKGIAIDRAIPLIFHLRSSSANIATPRVIELSWSRQSAFPISDPRYFHSERLTNTRALREETYARDTRNLLVTNNIDLLESKFLDVISLPEKCFIYKCVIIHRALSPDKHFFSARCLLHPLYLPFIPPLLFSVHLPSFQIFNQHEKEIKK